jgi:diacylglycerol kinase (ATP)
MKNIKFISNPISGVRNKGAIPALIDQYLDQSKFSYVFIETTHRGHAAEIAAASLNDNTDIIVIIGGDGSINEVSRILVHTNLQLGIIPGGSGNGISRHFRIPRNFKKAILTLNTAQPLTIDTGTINGNHFLGFCGLGYDAHIAHQFDIKGKRGFWNYVKLVLHQLRKFQKMNVIVKNMDNLIGKELYLCSFMNVSQFGNNFRISKSADPSDGKLDMVMIQRPPIFPMLRLFFLGFFGDIGNSRYVKTYREAYFQLNNVSSIAHIDGDPIELHGEEIEVRTVPQSLIILVPKN